MEAIILAGGMGTRLRDVIKDIPKPMAPVAGRPFLSIVLDQLQTQGFSRVILAVGYRSEIIADFFKSSYRGITLAYSIEQQPLGTGGAVREALKLCTEDHAYVLNGDTFLEADFKVTDALWRENRRPIVVAREVPDTLRYGRLDVVDGRLMKFAEKGVQGAGLINAGCYLLPADISDEFPSTTAFSLESDYLTNAVLARHFDVVTTKGRFIDIGIPSDYLLAQSLLAENS